MREDQITALLDVLGRIASALEVQAMILERAPQSVAERMIHERNAAAQEGNIGCQPVLTVPPVLKVVDGLGVFSWEAPSPVSGHDRT